MNIHTYIGMIKRVYTAFAQEDRSQVDWGLFFTLIFYPSWHLGAAPTSGSGVIALSERRAAPKGLGRSPNSASLPPFLKVWLGIVCGWNVRLKHRCQMWCQIIIHTSRKSGRLAAFWERPSHFGAARRSQMDITPLPNVSAAAKCRKRRKLKERKNELCSESSETWKKRKKNLFF